MAGDRILVLLNPSAGSGRAGRLEARLRSCLRRHGVPHDLVVTASEEELRSLAQGAARAGRAVAGAGGDSTALIVAREILDAGGRVPLGIVGLGSSNDVAREFGLDAPEAACVALRRAADGRPPRRIDLGRIRDEAGRSWIFLGQANLGIGVEVNRYVASLAARGKRLARLQTLAGILGAWRAYRSGRVPIPLAVETDRDRVEGRFVAAVFANTRAWASGRIVAPDAVPDDGRLDAALFGACSFLRLARIDGLARRGRIREAPEVRLLQSPSFRIASDAPFEIQADGEIVAGPGPGFRSVTIEAVPAALGLLA